MAQIRSDEELAAALARIEQLWEAPIGTPAGDELDELVVLVERYEAATLQMLFSRPKRWSKPEVPVRDGRYIRLEDVPESYRSRFVADMCGATMPCPSGEAVVCYYARDWHDWMARAGNDGDQSSRWEVVCQDAGDGSGDLIVELPDDLLQAAGLSEGDTLEIEPDPADSTAIRLRKVVMCDVCGSSTFETGYGVLQAQWRDGEREGMRLCKQCFGFAMVTLKREHQVRHLFDDDEPKKQDDA